MCILTIKKKSEEWGGDAGGGRVCLGPRGPAAPFLGAQSVAGTWMPGEPCCRSIPMQHRPNIGKQVGADHDTLRFFHHSAGLFSRLEPRSRSHIMCDTYVTDLTDKKSHHFPSLRGLAPMTGVNHSNLAPPTRFRCHLKPPVGLCAPRPRPPRPGHVFDNDTQNHRKKRENASFPDLAVSTRTYRPK